MLLSSKVTQQFAAAPSYSNWQAMKTQGTHLFYFKYGNMIYKPGVYITNTHTAKLLRGDTELSKFHTNMKNSLAVRKTARWNRLPTEAVESPVEIFRPRLDAYLCDCREPALARVGLDDLQTSPATPADAFSSTPPALPRTVPQNVSAAPAPRWQPFPLRPPGRGQLPAPPGALPPPSHRRHPRDRAARACARAIAAAADERINRRPGACARRAGLQRSERGGDGAGAGRGAGAAPAPGRTGWAEPRLPPGLGRGDR